MGIFPALRAGTSPLESGGNDCAPHSLYGFLQPPHLFLSAKEKEERPAGVEEKEGRLLSVCGSSPVGAENLS